jgi:hypothetical protein
MESQMSRWIAPLVLFALSACNPAEDVPDVSDAAADVAADMPTDDVAVPDAGDPDANVRDAGGDDGSADGGPLPACHLHAYHREQIGEVDDCSEATVPWESAPPTRASNGTMAHRWAPPCTDGGADCAPEDQARCLDGTRPAYYVDPAECETEGGCPEGSNRWVFFFQGGGACGDLSWCYDDVYTIPSEAGETSSAHPERMDLNDHKGGDGILSPAPRNAFADAHRVRILKCSFDRFQGDATRVETDADGRPVRMHFHGRRIIQAVLADLARANGTVTIEGHELPDFADAERVVISGNSGGAGGLIQNSDWLAEQIATHAPGASVAAVLDARFQPGAGNEAAWEKPGESCDGTCDAYDFDTAGTSSVQPDDGGAAIDLERDMSAYEPGGTFREFIGPLLADGAVAFDESCAEFHSDDPSPCFSERHVLLNHFGTDAFIHEAIFDSNHLSKGPGLWITSPDEFQWAQYSLARAERVVRQADTFMQERSRAHEPGPRIAIFLPGHNRHTSVQNDEWFLDGALCKGCGTAQETCVSYHDALVGWLQSSGEAAWVENEPRDPMGGGRVTLSNAMTDGAQNGWRWSPAGECP